MRVSAARSCLLPHEARYVACTPDRARLVATAQDGRFTVLDGALRVTHRGTLPVPAGSVAVHPRADLLAVASTEAMVVTDLAGTILDRRPHRPWEPYEGGAVEFVGDGAQVLAVLPGDGSAHATLLRPGSAGAVAEVDLEVPEPSGFHFVRSPAEGRWALWAGAGQDGQWTYWVNVERGRLSVEGVAALDGKDHGPVALHPSGRELLVSADDGLERYALPEMRLLGRVEPPDDGEFAFGECSCYLGSGRALVTDASSSRLHVVDLASGGLVDEVVVDGHEPRSAEEVYGLSGESGLCTDLWFLLGLPRAAALAVFGHATGPQTLVLLEGPPVFAKDV